MTKLVLLLSDIHSNLAALEAVLRDAEGHGTIEEVWSMGDAVGYGPQPNECVERLIGLGARAVSGNHELAALGRIPLDDFNPYAKAAAEWTGEALSQETAEYLSALPERLAAGEFLVVHGSPRNPAWEYILDVSVARESLPDLEQRNCAYGHTHVPAAFPVEGTSLSSSWPEEEEESVDVSEGRWFINPGSVGQPRDGDPRAAYAILDPDAAVVTFHRVEYPVAETQRLMEAAELPSFLAGRLEFGR